jgi:hypothetical protein
MFKITLVIIPVERLPRLFCLWRSGVLKWGTLNLGNMFFYIYGGETASTGIKKFRSHTKLLPACKNGGKLNIIADDYNYALAA